MPPRFLELSLNRIFRSRWGIALVILVLVLAVVGVGRLFAGSANDQPVVTSGTPAPAISIDPSDEDGPITDVEPTPTPVTSPGRAQPEAVAYAFASAWVDHKNVSAKAWHDGLVPNATKDLADQLEGVDPAGVPADRVLGRPGLVPVNDAIVNAVINVNSGKLTLRLVAPDGHWLVDDIDWEAS
jgi:hypothetical protein